MQVTAHTSMASLLLVDAEDYMAIIPLDPAGSLALTLPPQYLP